MDSPQTGLMPFGERVQATLEAETQPSEQLRLGRGLLLERITAGERRDTRAKQTRNWYVGLAAAATVVLAAGVAWSWTRPISFVTSAGTRAVGDVLEAAPRAPLRVAFSEGSRIVLQHSTRARVLDTQRAGARVLLEGGALEASIVHRRHTHWQFEVGPFHVRVTGTRFELGWQPGEQLLTLTMKSGSVELSGACLAEPRIVRRGGSLRLSCAKTPPVANQAAAGAETQTQAETAAAPAAPEPAASAPAGVQPAAPRAAKSLAPSFEAQCESVRKDELLALSNRERLAGRVVHARTALLVLRRRFAGSDEAGMAAFMLGRMAFEQQADYAQAARWFSSYLREQPSGPLMGDAAGRLLEAHARHGENDAARRDARAYLDRFPDGPYARAAKRVLAE